ncbi:MAG: hypothetical protein BWY88_01458 [Synergistetes bacterium ADurb.Bin520]|nr:MAG: hypothetical protein BWY88_01458 [Synergistetes bacterium ADurb.Bin520]
MAATEACTRGLRITPRPISFRARRVSSPERASWAHPMEIM